LRLTNKHILYFILAVGAVLRFWNYTLIPFSHDEFSALFRTNYKSFSDLIEFGVKPDGHPAGIQVFLYYWTSWFGQSEWLVKLPFVAFGLLSIYLIYRLGELWYNDTVGLVSATFLACLQFSIVYSVTARPYISGMFFVLAMVWFWSKLVKNPEQDFWKNGLLFVLFAALCAYNHHFSLLFAAIVGLSGLFILALKHLLKYMICGVLIFVVYLPHLQIFFHQLGNKGIEGWLTKPEPDFLWVFVRYIFHYSWLWLGLAIALVVLGFFKVKESNFTWKRFVLFGLWFLLPFLIGYLYSVKVNSVLQYSVLIFSFPFLFLAVFGHLKNQKVWLNGVLVLLIASVSIFTLAFNRKHFSLLYNSHYEQIVADAALHPTIPKLVDSHHEITEYYEARYKPMNEFQWCEIL